MERIKVIQLSHASHSFFSKGNEDFKELILSDFYFRVAKQLKKYYPEIEVECWGPERKWKTEKIEVWGGIKFRFFPTTFSPKYALDLSLSMLKALRKEIKESKKQNKKLIIHLHEYHNLHGLIIASKFRKENIIAQHHGGSWPIKHMRQTKAYRLFFPFFMLGQLYENLVLKNIKYFYALSEEEINYLKKKAKKSKIKFQTMGIGDEYFKIQNKNLARKKLKLSNKKIIIFIGRINEDKGIKYLLEAMKKLEKEEIELKIIGFGDIDKFKQQAKQLKLKNTEFVGPVFGEKKLLYLNAADALVLPSSKEGAPVVIMEALASNLPVIATDVGGVRNMLQNGKQGRIIKQKSSEEIANAIKEVLSWKKKNLQEYANKYKWKEIINSTVEDYKRI